MGITQILDLHPSKNTTMEEMTVETPQTVRSRGEHPLGGSASLMDIREHQPLPSILNISKNIEI